VLGLGGGGTAGGAEGLGSAGAGYGAERAGATGAVRAGGAAAGGAGVKGAGAGAGAGRAGGKSATMAKHQVIGADMTGVDPNVRKVQEALAKLKAVLAGHGASGTGVVKVSGQMNGGYSGFGMMQKGEAERLDEMMHVLQSNEGGNSEMAQLSAVLDKIVMVQRGLKDTVRREEPGEVERGGSAGSVKGFGSGEAVLRHEQLAVCTVRGEDDTLSGFDSLSIEAVVPEQQVIVAGEELRMELVKDIRIGKQVVPAGTPVYGLVNLSGERLKVKVNVIAFQERVYPVNLQVADEDGVTGIYIPGAPVSDAVRESTGAELGNVGPEVLTTNVAGQAAGAGVLLARSLIGKKIRPVKVTVPEGYRVLLTGENAGL
jgi:hypothetical protein